MDILFFTNVKKAFYSSVGRYIMREVRIDVYKYIAVVFYEQTRRLNSAHIVIGVYAGYILILPLDRYNRYVVGGKLF